MGITSVCVIGGESFDKQKEEIAKGTKIIVGTPGRICDLIKQKIIKSKDCNCVIFDEADRLFEMGFNKDNEFVLRSVKEGRQLIMVSATNNQEIFRTAYKFGSNPEEVKLNEDSLMVDNINQQVAMISEEEKMPYLVNLLRKNDDNYAIIFCNTQYMTSLVAIWLEQMGFKVKPISGKLPQNKRTQLLQDFRDKKINILVCTDVAARGLDIKDVNLVVNYDMPHEAPNYVHRVGRTGRAGKSGLAVGFCGYDDSENFEAITQYIGMQIPKADIEDEDFATDVVKRPRIDSKTLKPYENKKVERQPREKNKEAVVKNIKKEITGVSTPMNDVKVYERFFTVSTYSFEEAKEKALSYFAINEDSILEHEVIGKGKKKFFLFGPQMTNYKFKVKPIFRKILLPFLINTFKKMGLRVYVNVTFSNPNVSVVFSGEDAGLLLKNKFALHNAVKELAMNYLRNKISMASNNKITFKTEAGERPARDSQKPRKPRTNHTNNSKDEKELHRIAEKVKQEVKDKQEAVMIQKLNPAERRIIHLYFEKDPTFKSSSVGDGRFKEIEIDLVD